MKAKVYSGLFAIFGGKQLHIVPNDIGTNLSRSHNYEKRLSQSAWINFHKSQADCLPQTSRFLPISRESVAGMSETPQNEIQEAPRFSFGSMALSEERGRTGSTAEYGNADEVGSSVLGVQLDDDSPTNDTIDVLRGVVLNEQYSPDILPYQTDVIESVRKLVSTQTELVDAEEDDDNSDQLSFESQLKRMELDRINYQLRQYYRTRIKKIERFVMHIFEGDGPFDRLSEQEKRFAIGYSNLVEEHFKKSFLSLLPQRLQVMEKDGDVNHATPPPLDHFVFCRVRNDVGAYAIGEEVTDDSLDLNRDDIVCIRYKSIQELLKNGNVELI